MATRKPKQQDQFDALAAGDPQRVMALMLWKHRLNQPDMCVQIDEQDIQGFDDCVAYLKVKPQVRVYRPEGVPEQPPVPAQGNRRAIPGRAAIPPRPYVMVVLTDQKGDVIRPVENNQEDYDASLERAKVQRYRDNAPQLAQTLLNMAKSGEYSLAVMQECADSLVALSRTA